MQTSAKATSKVVLRLPADLHERLRAQAAAHDRSLNGEIVDALSRYVGAGDAPAEDTATADDARLRDAIARSERGETYLLTLDMVRVLRREIERGTPADEALARAGLDGGAVGG